MSTTLAKYAQLKQDLLHSGVKQGKLDAFQNTVNSLSENNKQVKIQDYLTKDKLTNIIVHDRYNEETFNLNANNGFSVKASVSGVSLENVDFVFQDVTINGFLSYPGSGITINNIHLTTTDEYADGEEYVIVFTLNGEDIGNIYYIGGGR